MSDSEDNIPLTKRAQLKSESNVINTKPSNGLKPSSNNNKNVDSDSGDDIPLSKRKSNLITPKIEESDSDDDIPLTKRKQITTTQQEMKHAVKEESSDEDDIPLSQRKPPIKKRVIKKEEESSDDDIPLNKRQKTKKVKVEKKENTKNLKRSISTKAEPKTNTKKAKKEEKEENEDVYKWWEEAKANSNGDDENGEDDGGIKWNELIHNGVLFPPEYVPHGIQMKYNGKPIKLSPDAEEVASFFAALLETDHAKNPTFQKNFFRDFQEILATDPSNPKLESFEKCDFRPIWEKFEADKEKKKALTKEEKLILKEERTILEEPFLYAIVDGRKEKIGNFRIEPPSLFRGRGDHPKTGTLKKRVYPEQVTLNLSKNAKIPPTIPGHKWKKIVNDQEATWLATWKENVNGSIKYVFLAANSAWKGQSDMMKFDKARELKKYIDSIRKDYTTDLKDKLSEKRQRATAMYLIDRLALRAGNEKGDDEADTVGCCSLRYEHVELEPPNVVHFDFLGKDSIRYQNSVPVDPQVFKNLKIFKKQVGPGHMIFDRLTTTGLNKHLNNYMKGLSAKVFRTFNASHTCEQQLEKLTNMDESIPDKILSFNRANREVAVLCNHQRSASKSHAQQMLKIEDKIRALKYQRMKLRKQLFQVNKSLKKKRPELNEDESDMDDEWIIEHEKSLVEKEREKAKTKFEKQNEKLKAEGEKPQPKSELEAKLKEVDEYEKQLKKERKTGVVEVKQNVAEDKILAKIEKIDERISATKNQATDKEENKEVALGTSKMNYIDPRIIIAWCRKYEVPVEKVYSKTLVDKFRWAQNIPDGWRF